MTDVHGYKLAEEELIRSEERYRLLAEDATDIIARTDLNGIRRYLSPSSREWLGYEPDELIGTSIKDFIHPDDWLVVSSATDELVRGHAAHVTYTCRHLRKDGSWVWVEARRRVMRDDDGEPVGFVSFSRDISERIRLEEQLRHSQKMEAVGRLAGGVAHDFNNLLTAIMGYTDLAAAEAADSPIREWLDEVKKASARAAALTQQLLAFGRRQIFTPRTVNLNAVIADTRGMLERIIGEDIILRTDLGDAPPVHLDAGQFAQVLMNLVVNARDAMPQGGEITIRSFAEERAGRQYALVTVEDTGTGIPEDVLPHIFEPFFTTKDMGKGSGLGLAVCYGILAQAGGSIDAQKGSRGTVFTIAIPARPAPEQTDACTAGPAPVRSRGTETILVVEDEDQVRELACRALRGAGYTVISAGDADGAMAEWDAAPSIDLLLTDVVMPGRSGPQLAADLRARNPGLKVLYVSGYADSRHMPLDASELLPKPYAPHALLSRVRSTLDASSTTPEPVV